MLIDENGNSEALRILDEIMSESKGYNDLSKATRSWISKKQFEEMSKDKQEAIIKNDTEEFVRSMNQYKFKLD